MRILFLTNNLIGKDGWSRYSFNLINNLQNQQGFEIICLTSSVSNHKFKPKKVKEIQLLEEPLRYLANPLLLFHTALRINRLINKFVPQGIHFLIEPYAFCLPFLTLKGCKTFLTIYGTYAYIPNLFPNNFYKRLITRILTDKVYKKIDGVISVSNFTKRYLLRNIKNINTNNLDKKIEVINPGIDSALLPDQNDYAQLLQRKQNLVKKILFIGEVKYRKGILEAVNALKHYYDKFSDKFIFYIIGDYHSNDEYFKQVLALIKKHQLKNNIVFKGKVSDSELLNLYQEADLFLMLSLNNKIKFEGFGLVYLEANSQGVPCIASFDCGAQEAVLDGYTGYLVNPFDPSEIAEKINLILNKKTISSIDCIEWAKKNIMEVKFKEYLNFYNKILR